jgi:hypothetical protein
VAPPKTDFDREMQVLDAEIRRLEAEYNMFFAGRLPRLPWETRTRVEALVKKHDRSFIRNTADRFRFESMQNRYAKFCELWERQLSQMEGGRPRRGGKPPPSRTPEPAAAAVAPVPSGDSEIRFSSARDPEAEAARVQELFERLGQIRKAAGEEPLPYDRVAALVKAQVKKYAADGSEVAFRVAVKNGKVSLTVKPVTGEK